MNFDVIHAVNPSANGFLVVRDEARASYQRQLTPRVGMLLGARSNRTSTLEDVARGTERNYSRLGEKLADSLGSADADLDLDGSLSLLEAVLHASAATKAFYDDTQRVVPEHAVIDDNGDGRTHDALPQLDQMRKEGLLRSGLLGFGGHENLGSLPANPRPVDARARRSLVARRTARIGHRKLLL